MKLSELEKAQELKKELVNLQNQLIYVEEATFTFAIEAENGLYAVQDFLPIPKSTLRENAKRSVIDYTKKEIERKRLELRHLGIELDDELPLLIDARASVPEIGDGLE